MKSLIFSKNKKFKYNKPMKKYHMFQFNYKPITYERKQLMVSDIYSTRGKIRL